MAADAHKDAHVPVSLALARLSFISSLDTLTDVSYIYIYSLFICVTSNLILPHVFVLAVLTGTLLSSIGFVFCQLNLSASTIMSIHLLSSIGYMYIHVYTYMYVHVSTEFSYYI